MLWVSKRPPVRYVLVWGDKDPLKARVMNPRTGQCRDVLKTQLMHFWRPSDDYKSARDYANRP